MATMDIFNSSPFTMVELTDALNKVPFQPNLLGTMDLFAPRPVRTLSVAVEQRTGVLSVIQTSPRGAPLNQRTTEKRDIRDFRTNRIAKGDRINADEIQGIRAFGSETELMGVQQEVARRLNGPAGLLRDIELTHENMRLGAVQGIVADSDGSIIRNWFTEFGIAQAAELNFDLENAAPAPGAVRKMCNKVVRAMMTNAQGAWVSGQSYVQALCGDAFWDDLTAHSEVRQTYLNTTEAAQLRTGNAYESFWYGGIRWLNYRGTDDGSTVAVPTDKAKFFPVNAPGVFEVAYSPAETFNYVNTPGMPYYAMIVPDDDRNMFVDIEVYSYPLFMCTRPAMLQRAKRV